MIRFDRFDFVNATDMTIIGRNASQNAVADGCTLKIYCFTILLRLHLNLIKATSCNVLLKEKRLLELNAAVFLVMKKMYFMKS